MQDEPYFNCWRDAKMKCIISNYVKDIRKISLKPEILRALSLPCGLEFVPIASKSEVYDGPQHLRLSLFTAK